MTFIDQRPGMSTATVRLLSVLLLALFVSTPLTSSDAQELVDLQLLAVSATEASLVADQIGAIASSESGDAEALQRFRGIADEAATLLSEIGSASLQGEGLAATRPLFEQTAALAHQAMRVGRAGGISIEPAVLDEFARRITELEAHYYPRPQSP